MISDQDRKLAEEAFDLIERSQHVEEDMPAVTPESGDWGWEPMECYHGQPVTLADRTDSPDPRTPHPIATASDAGIHNPVKFTTLADHTDSPLGGPFAPEPGSWGWDYEPDDDDEIGDTQDEQAGPGVGLAGPIDRTQGCTCEKNPYNFRLSHHDSCALVIAHAGLADHTDSAIAKILGA